MFSVYGVGGRVFSGTLEQMRRVSPVNATTRQRAAKAMGGDAPATDFDADLTGVPGSGAKRYAVAAYAQTQQGALQRHPLTRVDEVMSRGVVTVPATSVVALAWQRLAQQNVAQAPVIDGNGTLVGLFLRSDLLRSELLATITADPPVWQALLAQPVTQLMRTPVPAVTAWTEIRQVAGVLLDTGLPGLAVTDELGGVIGFVARSDIVRAVANDPPVDLWG